MSSAASNTKHVDGKPSLPALPTSWLSIYVNAIKLPGFSYKPEVLQSLWQVVVNDLQIVRMGSLFTEDV
jgi:hypothetical protein